MKAVPRLLILTCCACAVAISACADIGDEIKYAFRISDNTLFQGKLPFVVNAIQVPPLMRNAEKMPEFAAALAAIADVGADVVCFDLAGFSADGKLVPDTAAKIDKMLEQINWRRLGAMCKVFGADAPKDAAYREAAAKAAAAALKNVRRVIFWIDGPEAERVVKTFRQEAPELVIAAEKGGDIDVVTQPPTAKPVKPVLVAGAIPAPELRGSVHFVLPDKKESYSALDAAVADPGESKPWTPDNSKLSEQERAEGFVSLFDGKTHDGWWILGENKNGFKVKDGAIEWAALGGKGLYTRDRYDNFVLRLEWKINKKGNSGLYLRAPRAGRQSKIGMEFQLQGDSGTPITDQTTGAVYDVVPPLVNACKPEGEWNSTEITLNGPNMKASLNGEVVQDLNLDQNDELRPRLRRGFIGLQDHACYVAFRNIRIKKL